VGGRSVGAFATAIFENSRICDKKTVGAAVNPLLFGGVGVLLKSEGEEGREGAIEF
jgi:hypothetical protein